MSARRKAALLILAFFTGMAVLIVLADKAGWQTSLVFGFVYFGSFAIGLYRAVLRQQ